MPPLLKAAAIAIGAVALLILFILSLRGTLTIAYDGEFSLYFRVLFFNIKLLPWKKRKKRYRKTMSARKAKMIRIKARRKAERRRLRRKKPVPEEQKKPEEPKKLSFIAPVSGRVMTGHDLTVPVFSVTLEEWRVHAGIDISCAEAASVFAAEDGVVSAVYNDPMLGATVEITHDGDIVTVYSNLASGENYVKVGDTVMRGAKIGTVGDTSISELAEETHIHFRVKKSGVAVDPLTVISEESKEASLGITK